MRAHLFTQIAAALILTGFLAGCSSPENSDHSDEHSKGGSSAAQATPTHPTITSTPKLKNLLLAVDEVPTGGWKLTDAGNGDETSTDHDTPGVCAMDLSNILGKQAKNHPQANKIFARDDPQAILIEGIVSTPDAQSAARTIESRLEQCPSKTTFTASGKQKTTRLKPLDVGEFGETTICRSFTINTRGLSNNSVYGNWCMIADKNLLLTVGTSATFEPYKVKKAEYVKLLKAAMTKAEHGT